MALTENPGMQNWHIFNFTGWKKMFFLTHSFDQVTPPRRWPHHCSPYQVWTPSSPLQRPPPVFPACISSLTRLHSSRRETPRSALSLTGPHPSPMLSLTLPSRLRSLSTTCFFPSNEIWKLNLWSWMANCFYFFAFIL